VIVMAEVAVAGSLAANVWLAAEESVGSMKMVP